MAYNYLREVKNDCVNAIKEQIEAVQNMLDTNGKDATISALNDDFWTDDNITGNGSGSYTFNKRVAFEYVKYNEYLLQTVIDEYCIEAKTIADHFMDWEYWDVSIRCYLLYQAIELAIDELVKNGILFA